MIRHAATPPARVTWHVAASPAGKLLIGATDQGAICRVAFMRAQSARDVVAAWAAEWPHTVFTQGTKTIDWTRAPILLTGTAFQYRVWRAMTKIPAGRTASYGEIAHAINQPNAARAVGMACGANPVPYFVPCHRVVAAGGKIGGFSSGLDIKVRLLKAEGVALSA